MGEKNYVNANINPCKMCMPMGATLAIKGLEGSIILMHSSQGCATYIRRHIAQHFNEPMDIASSALTEKDTVYGGAENLKKALRNVIKVYQPKTIGIITSCLAETIGEDIDRIVTEFLEEEGLSEDDIKIFSAGTPGYGGTQFEGFYYSMRRAVEKFAKKVKKHKKINIITGMISPGDIRYLKSVLREFDLEAIILPDISDTLDAPFKGTSYDKIPKGGTKIADIEKMGGSRVTIEFGVFVNHRSSPGEYLKDNFGVPLYKLPIPIGLKNSDLFFETLSKIADTEIPECFKMERGRMLDAMIDSHKYNGEGKGVIFGEPELTASIASLCIEIGVKPDIISTGAKTGKLKEYLNKKFPGELLDTEIMEDVDFEKIREKTKQKNSNILIGHFEGKFITEKEGIPLVRVGFPIHDRVGAQRQIKIGYFGSIDLMDKITNTLLYTKYSTYRERMYQEHFNENLEGYNEDSSRSK
ncbi:MAG: nitrogenase component 1 [Fusobacteriota bacterium]